MSSSLLRVPFPSDSIHARVTSFGDMERLLVAGSADYNVFSDMFWGDQLDAKYPDAKTDTGTVTFTEHNLGHFLEFKSSAGNDKYAGQGVGLQWSGDRGILMQGIIKTPAAITTMKFEFGLSDADDIAGAVLQKADTSTGTGTEFAVLVFDTDDDTNIAFITSNGGTVVSTQDIVAAAVSTTYRFAVRVDGDSCSAYINNELVAGGPHLLDGSVALTPWCFVQARDASERILQLHTWSVIEPAY